MIWAQNIRKSFPDGKGPGQKILEGLCLDVAAGQFAAVVGPSGSGKSTLLHILGGLDLDYQGEVTVAGVRLNGAAEKQLSVFRNRSVGFVFQSFHLIPNLSTLQNVALPSLFAKEADPDATFRAEAALKRVGLLDVAHRLPSALSGGERQRVAVARAIFGRPHVLLCDEPTGNLDAKTGDGVIDVFRSLNAEGLTVLAVTHEERLRKAATRVFRMTSGRLESET